MTFDDFIQAYPPENRRIIAVTRAENEEVVGCVARAIREQVARFILIGDRKKTHSVAHAMGADLGDSQFVDANDDVAVCNTAAQLVRDGKAQLMMKGLVQTSTFTRAMLARENGLRLPDGHLSHVAVMEIPGYPKLLLMTDGGINIAPDVDQKAKLIRNAIAVAHGLRIERPKVALGSAVEKVTEKMQSTVDAQALVEMAADGAFGDAIVEGPLGLDVILDEECARIKGIDSRVAGDTDILLAPQIESGNFFYKTLTRFCKARVAGVVVGCKAPAIVTSRADSEEAKFFSLCLAVRLTG